MKICMIDDDDLLRDAIVTGLRAKGFDVVGACNGVEGLALIAAVDARIAIVDIFMPEMDGLEVIADIHTTMPHVRTIVISGGGRLDGGFYLHAARDLGAYAVLAKPIDIDRLGEMLRHTVNYAA